ncbi:MAG: thiolase family protein [Planctomyces sp.]|nr:thiolase family protein [Planctomyces sp.]
MKTSSRRVVIVGAKRTPIGRFGGRLSSRSPAQLGLYAARAALGLIEASSVQAVIIGQVLSAGHGMNIARQISVKVGVPLEVPAFTINMMCGSGLHAASQAALAIRSGEADVVLCGGVESMSQSPLLVTRPRKGQTTDFSSASDSMQSEGLLDAFSGQHMGITAERLASEYSIDRKLQDQFAERSQHLYAAANAAGIFDEERIQLDDVFQDEHPRPEVTAASLGTLTPIFREDGTVTAGNSSGINDGAAMLVLSDAATAQRRGYPILAEWAADSAIGCEPERMGLGPVHAIQKLLQKTNVAWSEIDHVEVNEAFAAQTLACVRELERRGLRMRPIGAGDPDRSVPASEALPVLNPHGGAIALGHPLAASGARLVCHAASQIRQQRAAQVIVSLCVGGGMGVGALLREFRE